MDGDHLVVVDLAPAIAAEEVGVGGAVEAVEAVEVVVAPVGVVGAVAVVARRGVVGEEEAHHRVALAKVGLPVVGLGRVARRVGAGKDLVGGKQEDGPHCGLSS